MERNFKTTNAELRFASFDIFDDKATKSKIDKHLVDINDTITEDDIRNIKVSFTEFSSRLSSEKEISSGKSVSTWDILDAEA